MKKFNPKVSIIIPVYNGSNYLREAIDSALAQTYKNIEIIVVNDGSNDRGRTEKIAKSYGDKIRYFKKKNGGVASALNLGVRKMNGEYFSWLSHDDLYYPDKIKRQIGFLKKGFLKALESTVLYSDFRVLDEINSVNYENKIPDRLTEPKYFKRNILKEGIHGSTLLIPIGAVVAVGYFDEKFKSTQDYDFILRLIQEGFAFAHCPGLLTLVRVHSGQDGKTKNYITKEKEDLFFRILESFSLGEMSSIYGSEYNFYIQARLKARESGLLNVCVSLNKKIKKIEDDTIHRIKSTQTRITVITPVYNRENLIVDVLDSISKQTYDDYKYIILDDGSRDDTGEIVSSYIYQNEKDNWFYLYHDNIGEAETVNRGWGLCDTEYFTQINSDDPVKPDLFREMVKCLDSKKDKILGYPDFDIINKDGDVIDEVKGRSWDRSRHLSSFSCYAAAPGVFIKKSLVPNINKLKDGRFKHTNDINFLWNLSLLGDFIHVPKNLACWMSHESGISSNRYEAIEEINIWLNEFFERDDLPGDILKIKDKCWSSVFRYYSSLILSSNLPERKSLANYYIEKSKIPGPKYKNLQIGDNDLIGNKFNGHDLHINLRKMNIESSHLVWNKESDDNNTYIIAGDKPNRDEIRGFSEKIREYYDLDGIHNPLMYEIIYNRLFIESDIVHLHLLHNGLWDLSLLPLMSGIKPIVWTIHDMWVATGSRLADTREDYYFPIDNVKNLDLHWFLKSDYIKRAKNITFIVASEYMKKAVEEYGVFNSNKIYHVPFGLDFNIFYPRDIDKIKKELGLNKKDRIVLFRGDGGIRKGLNYIEHAIERLSVYDDIHYIIVGGLGLKIPNGIKYTHYGWVKDDDLMAKLYSVADLLLMPSTRENFGMMAIESMACGTLPIVIDGTALPDTVNAPYCGVSTEASITKYVSAVEYYLNDEASRLKRRDKCIEYVRKKHDMKKYLDSLDMIYRRAIKDFKPLSGAGSIISSIKKHNILNPILLLNEGLCSNGMAEIVTCSNSWAITKPLRIVYRFFRAIIGFDKSILKEDLEIRGYPLTDTLSWKVTKPFRRIKDVYNYTNAYGVLGLLKKVIVMIKK